MVSQVVNLKPDVIFMVSTRLLIMLKGATATIPLVGVMADPVRFGLVASCATGWQHHRGRSRSGIESTTSVTSY